uniref:Transcription factor TFIIIC triple barrel domain-containing protein n=1 Tax=Biomphalaria glabrata TaxID=6526 RepID=A0A2C9M810_BIOGL
MAVKYGPFLSLWRQLLGKKRISNLPPMSIMNKRLQKVQRRAGCQEVHKETVLMLELPELDNKRTKDSYLQILGLATDNPIVKINNQLYSSKMANTLGSHLFLEVSDNTGGADAMVEKIHANSVMVTDKSLKLEPVYLEKKPNNEPTQSSQ